jgi:hypothetical protein
MMPACPERELLLQVALDFRNGLRSGGLARRAFEGGSVEDGMDGRFAIDLA